MEIKGLTGGRVIGTNPDRLQMPLYADPPKARVGAPGTLFGNTGLYAQVNECAKLQFGTPEPTMAKVLFRETDAVLYLLIGPANAPGPDVYELKFEQGNKTPTIRGLKPLFDQAQITLRTDLWYEAQPEIVKDETLGYAVAVNWTKVTTRPRRAGEEEVAAAQQPGTDE